MKKLKKILMGILFLTTSILTEAKYEKFMPKNIDLKPEIFDKAYSGYLRIENRKPGLLAIVDYSKNSDKKRFYVIDVVNNKLIYQTYVAHSKNSGFEKAVLFSDVPNSYQSSLGFFLCAEPYNGAFGYSLRLKGLEKGINSNAEKRAIVIHGSENSEESFIKDNGFLGRSLGCYVLPKSLTAEIIDVLKEGTVLFVYADDEEYDTKTLFKGDSLEPIKFDNIPNYNPLFFIKDENKTENKIQENLENNIEESKENIN